MKPFINILFLSIIPFLLQAQPYTGPIIDVHIHAYSEQTSGMLGLTHPPTLRGETYEGVKTLEAHQVETFRAFKEYNIVKAVVADGESWYPGHTDIVMVGGAKKPVEELRKQHAEGKLQAMTEMAPFYEGVRADDPSLDPYFALAEELKIPVGFHIFPGGPNYGYHLMPEMLGGMRTYNANPQQLEDVLIKYPNLKLYIMHGGWPYVDDVKALMYAHPNLYVDVAVINWILPREEFYAYLKSLITAGFGNRIMHGTDQMVWPQLIGVSIEAINSADFLTLEQKEDLFYDNAAEFLGLSEEEIRRHKGN